MERANKDRKDNKTEKERRGMRDISRRKDIVIQAADKGRAIVVMEKDGYKDKMKEQITEEYGIIGKNTKIIKSNEEGYGKKRLRNRRKKYINKEGNIPKMRGLPKTHKEEIGMRPIVNWKGTILEELEA